MLLLAATVIAAASGGTGPASSTEAERLISAQSNRSAYWRVAAEVFAEHPLKGIGSGSFGVEWLQRREIAEAVRDAHSLYLETAAELGLVGLAALVAFLAGIVFAARRSKQPAAIAALAAFALHAGLDWDWELPALSLVAILLAARVIAAQEP
jgi:O-antigen ligase